MKDANKTKKQLINELTELRQRIAELEAQLVAPGGAEEKLSRSQDEVAHKQRLLLHHFIFSCPLNVGFRCHLIYTSCTECPYLYLQASTVIYSYSPQHRTNYFSPLRVVSSLCSSLTISRLSVARAWLLAKTSAS